MSENENIDPKKPARTSKASATPHKPGCGCPRCVYRRRKTGEPPIPTARPSARAGSRGRPADDQAGARDILDLGDGQAPDAGASGRAVDDQGGERDLLGLGDGQAPEWANVLEMIASEFPDLQGDSWKPWRTYLKVVNAVPLDPDELAFAQAHTGRSTMPTSPVRRAFMGAGRRGGKSLIAALQVVYLATKKRAWSLAPGEWSTVPIVAADRPQARVIHGYVKGLLAASPRLRGMVVKATKDTITLSNRTKITVFTASYKTSRGYSLAAACGDEIAFWENAETSTNPDKEILIAIRPGLMTTGGPLLISSTPYARRGELWEAFKQYYGKNEARGIYWKASSLDMNPGLDAVEIADAYEEDPEAAAAEYGGEFRSDLVAFISEELIAAVVVEGRAEVPYNAKHTYYGFVDPSGGAIGGDSYTLAIGHPEQDVMVIDAIREVVPPYSPEGVTVSLAEVCAHYHVREIEGDKYAAEWPVEQWRKHGVVYRQSAAPKSDLYLTALPVLTSGKAELLEHKRLIAQLRGLERRTARSGKDSVDHAPRGRDDIANAVCGLIALMKRKRRSWGHIPPTAITQNTAGDIFVNGQHVRGPAHRPGLVRTPRGDWESYHDPRGEVNHG